MSPPNAPPRPVPPPPPPPRPPAGAQGRLHERPSPIRAGAPVGPTPKKAGPRPSPVRELFAGNPGRLRLLGGISIAACLLFALAGATVVRHQTHDLGNARADAAQLVRVQAIRTSLVTAHANATNAFLVGGLEPQSARQAYLKGIDDATSLLAQAAAANASDAAVLRGVNSTIATYTGNIESARANNRQGFPVGAAYLRQANVELRDSVLPSLAGLVQTIENRVANDYDTSHLNQTAFAVPLFIALAALLYTMFWLYRRTHRVINVGLGIAVLLVGVAGIIGSTALSWSQQQADKAQRGAYRAAVALATVRVDAFDARSAESLALISRGSDGGANKARFDALTANAASVFNNYLSDASQNVLETESRSAFAAYLKAHDTVVAADQAGNWDQAVAIATRPEAALTALKPPVLGSNQTFDDFDNVSARALTQRSQELTTALGDARSPLGIVALLTLVAGLAAALFAWRGVSIRLREYR